jgi:hypothetical protein
MSKQEPGETHKTLGVMVDPNGKTVVEILLFNLKADTCANCIRMSKITLSEA